MAKKKALKSESFAGTPLCPDDAARLVLNVCEILQHKLPNIPCTAAELSTIFNFGIEVYKENCHTEQFGRAVELYLATKIGLRPASLQECRNVLRRMVRQSPDLAKCAVRNLNAQDCVQIIFAAYQTPHTSDKARRLLHCFFNYAIQQNWCSKNPVSTFLVTKRLEQPINVLTLEQVNQLLTTAALPEHRCCAAAVGIMLWAGIRPAEVARLQWKDINSEDNLITVARQISKTGGARLVTILPVLQRWLHRWKQDAPPTSRVVPSCWVRRWKALRRDAGLEPWRPDTLRHTFASYHLVHYRDIYLLQTEMGHSSAKLLFSRYLNQFGLTRNIAAKFWEEKVISFPKRSPRLAPY